MAPVMIEVTRGCLNKYEVEKETGQLMLDRVLHSALYYPGDYGYVPQTLCGDGDPIDVLVVGSTELEDNGLDTGAIANCRLIGIMDMEDENGRDEKLIAVLAEQDTTSHITSLEQISPHCRREIQHFFENYKKLEVKKGKQKWAKVLGWGDRAEALSALVKSRRMYEEALEKLGGAILHPFVKVPKCPNMLHVRQRAWAPGASSLDATCYINVSQGSRNSYVYRQDTTYRHWKYALNMPYPGNYGWITQTWQREVRLPVEVLILCSSALTPECLADVRIIGGIERSTRRVKKDGYEDPVVDYKMIAILQNDPRVSHLQTLSDVSPALVRHLSNFFIHTAEMARSIDISIGRALEAEEAAVELIKARASYEAAFPRREVDNAPNLWGLPWGSNTTQGPIEERTFPCIVEASKGSTLKYAVDAEYGVLRCEGVLVTAIFWPANLGLIPQTISEKGKPVSVMILSTAPLENRSSVEIRVVGAAECIDELGPEMKVVGVPKSEPRMREWNSIDVVPKHIKDEMVQFFNSCKDLEDSWKFCRFERWICAEETVRCIQQAHSRYFYLGVPMNRMEKRLNDLEEENRKLRALLSVQDTAQRRS